MNKTKITKSVVDGLKPAKADQYLWDADIRGFGFKVTPKGKKVYLLQYRLGGRSGRTRRYTIGEHGRDGWTPATARKRALELRDQINRGDDPMAARDKRRATPRVDHAFAEYTTEQIRLFSMRKLGSKGRRGWKPLTAKMNERMARLFILPRFGRRLVTDISKGDVSAIHSELGDTPRQANNVMQLLSGFFNWLEKTGRTGPLTNPVKGIDRYEENSVERYLNTEELARLGKALSAYELHAKKKNLPIQIAEAAAIKLAIFTGMRIGEILPLRLDWVDFDAREIRLPDSKVGARIVPLNAPALSVLSDAASVANNPHVFVGQKEGKYLPTLQRAWRKIRKTADLEDTRLNDLRHSHASFGVTTGAHMRLIAGILGHNSTRTTERYAHADTDPLRAASENIGKRIADAMDM